jgi:prevent-host-death family protein
MGNDIVAASQFKQHCLELIDDVERTGQSVVITKHGRPVARLCPLPVPRRSLVGALKGKMRITGDIVSPILEWGSDTDPLANATAPKTAKVSNAAAKRSSRGKKGR